jgi:2-phospho-L-lactate guanylyltransferase
VDAGILPVKSPRRAKARLAADLSDEARKQIADALIEDALDLCGSAPFLRWWVVSDDDAVRRRARARGFDTVADPGEGLNEALAIAVQAVSRAGARSTVVLPVDVPLATSEDIRDLVDTGATSEVVIVPSEGDGGTNGLYLSPPDIMPPRFGAGSLNAHVQTAAAKGLRCSVLVIDRIGLDIDTLADVDALLDRGPSTSRTFGLCLSLRRAPA